MNYLGNKDTNSQDILGHMVNGAVASAIAASTINFRRVKNEEANVGEAVREVVKRTSQGAVATGAAIATANHLGNKNFFSAVATTAAAVAGIYALEVLDDKLQGKQLAITNDNQTIKIEEEK